MAFFKRKPSLKDEINRDEDIQSLLEKALEPISDTEVNSDETLSEPENILDSPETLDDLETSIYEDLLKSADLPILSDEEILDAEKEERLKQSKNAQIKTENLGTELSLPVENFKAEDINAETLSPLEIPEPENESDESENLHAKEEIGISDEVAHNLQNRLALDDTMSLEDKIDAQILISGQRSMSRQTDVGDVRVDVARISADIQSGEELYRRAQIRIESLTQFVEHAEIDMAALKRLEPENRDLKQSNQSLASNLEKAKRKISILEADLEDHRKRLKSRDEAAEISQTRLAKASKSLHDYDLALKSAQQTAKQNYLKLERNETTLDVERRENKLLQERMKTLSKALDDKRIKLLESEKTCESLKEDYAVLKTQTAKLEDNNSGFRNALDEATKQNNQMKGKLISLHEDIRNFKSQSEFNLSAREERILKLETQIDELTRQVEIKDEILCNTARDVSDLRKARTIHNEERGRLEHQIDSLSQQLAEAQTKLLRLGKDTTHSDRRYHDVAEAIAKAQSVQSVKNTTVSNTTSPTPLEEKTSTAPSTANTTNVISETEIANRILNYKRNMESDPS